jgi:hypothetical protein
LILSTCDFVPIGQAQTFTNGNSAHVVPPVSLDSQALDRDCRCLEIKSLTKLGFPGCLSPKRPELALGRMAIWQWRIGMALCGHRAWCWPILIHGPDKGAAYRRHGNAPKVALNYEDVLPWRTVQVNGCPGRIRPSERSHPLDEFHASWREIATHDHVFGSPGD